MIIITSNIIIIISIITVLGLVFVLVLTVTPASILRTPVRGTSEYCYRYYYSIIISIGIRSIINIGKYYDWYCYQYRHEYY
jgi:hypothetical protein